MVSDFFPLGAFHYLAGGLLLGCAVSLLFVATGLIGGMSSVFSTTLSWFSGAPFFGRAEMTDTRAWRLIYAAGLIGGGLIYLLLHGIQAFATTVPWWKLLVGGFLAGFGARLSRGCTSGHGICGLASLQVPSLLAVLTFLFTAIATAQVGLLIGDVK